MKAIRIPLTAFCALVSFALMAEDLVIGNETVTFDSGERAYDSLTLGCAANWNYGRLNLAGDSSTTFGSTKVGCINNAHSYITVSNNAVAAFGNIAYQNSWTIGNCYFYFTVTNDAQVTFGNFSGNTANGSHWAYATFAGDSYTKQTDGGLWKPYSGAALCTVGTVQERATLDLDSAFVQWPANKMVVKDRGTLVFRTGMELYNSVDVLTAQDDATVILKNGGKLDNIGAYSTTGIVLKDRAKMIVSGGTFHFGVQHTPSLYLTISNQASFVSTNKINVGRGFDQDRPQVFLRLCGGTIEFPGFTYGTSYPQSAWQGSMTNLYANGGTMRPLAANPSFIRYWKLAELDGEGLTLDTAGFATGVQQAFTGTKFTKTGEGVLTVNETSEHETTVVRGGTLKFAAGVTRFGKALVVAGGTVSTTGDGTGFSCDALTLGDETAAGVLEVDGSDVVTVADGAALTIVNGQVHLPDAETLATIGFLKVASGTVDAAALERLSVNNALLTREYEFKAVQGDDGVMIQVEVKELSSSDVTWTGATDGDWSKSANWSPTKVPTISANATFPYAASHKEVEINSDAAALKLTIESDYDFSGDGALMTPEIALAEGVAASFANPIEMPSDSRLTVPADSELTLGGALTTAASTQTASLLGEGKLKVSGDNTGFTGGWNFLGSTGTVEFASANAAGVTSAERTLAVGPSTLAFTGDAAQTVTQRTQADPGADTSVTIFQTDVDTTFSSGIDMASGAFVKTGVGTMTAYYAGGAKRYIAKSTPDKGNVANRGTYSPVTIPESGSGVTTGAGFSGVNVLEGTLVLDGVSGAQVSDNNQYSVIGGNYSNGTANAVLHVKNISLTSGQHDNYTIIGSFPPEGAMDHPKAVVTDGATWEVGELALGAGYTGRTTPYYPTLAVTNAEVKCNAALHFGSHRWCHAPCIHPVVRIGPGGKVGQYKGNYPNVFRISRNVDVLVDGGELYDFGGVTLGGGELANKNCIGQGANNNYSGELKFVNGGKFTVCKINSGVTLADKSLMTDFIFDGGVLKLKNTATSYVADPANVKVTTCGAGMEVQVASGITHQFAIPITGAGGVVKTGAGTLVLTNRAEDVLTTVVAFSGPLTVSEGVVDFCGADLSSVGAVSGAGTVRNATGIKAIAAVKDATADTLTTFEAAAFATRVKVDFSGSTWTKGETVPVLKIGSGAMPNLKAVKVGDRLSASFAVLDGVVWATVCDAPGLVLLVK